MSARGGWISSFSGLPRPVPSTGSVYSLALVLERALARERRAHDLHVLARARDRPRERHSVPALRHLRARHAEAQAEAPVRERVERGRGHRRHRRRAGGNLEQARAQADPLGHRAHVAEHGGGVLAPRLGDPHGVEALAVGLLRKLDLLLGGVPGPVGEEEPDAHAAILCARARAHRRAGRAGGAGRRSRAAQAWTPDVARPRAPTRSSVRAMSRSPCGPRAASTASAAGGACARRAW